MDKAAFVIGLFFVLIGGFLIFTQIPEKQFVKKELPNWTETTAEIKDSVIRSEKISSDKDEDGYYSYSVIYDLTVVFYTDNGEVSFEKSDRITGETRSGSIPSSERDKIYKSGQKVNICYDPKNPAEFRFGTKDRITAEANIPFVVLIPAGLCFAVGLLMLALCIPRKKKHAQAQNQDEKGKI